MLMPMCGASSSSADFFCSSDSPFQSGAKAKDLQDLKGLEGVLAKAWSGWKLDELMGTVQGEYRTA